MSHQEAYISFSPAPSNRSSSTCGTWHRRCPKKRHVPWTTCNQTLHHDILFRTLSLRHRNVDNEALFQTLKRRSGRQRTRRKWSEQPPLVLPCSPAQGHDTFVAALLYMGCIASSIEAPAASRHVRDCAPGAHAGMPHRFPPWSVTPALSNNATRLLSQFNPDRSAVRASTLPPT